MLTKQDFLDAGYNHFERSFLFQKDILDEKGDVKYYINAYDPEEYNIMLEKQGIELEGFTIKIYYRRNKDIFLIEIFANREHTIKYIENLAEEFYNKMGMDINKDNN